MQATLDFAHRLTQAKSLQEATQLQPEFNCSQFAVVRAQAQELGNLAQNAAEQSRMPKEEGGPGQLSSMAACAMDKKTQAPRRQVILAT